MNETNKTIDVEPTVEIIRQMAEKLRKTASELDAIADRTQADGNFACVSDAVSCVASAIPHLRLDLLVTRPLRVFDAN